MQSCRHAYHDVVVEVFDHIARVNKVPVKAVTDGVFLDGFEPLIIDVYEQLNKRAPENEGVIYCCPKCGCYDLVCEDIAMALGFQCS